MGRTAHSPECMDEKRKADQRRAEWARQWVNYCTHCEGWGGHTFYESHGSPELGSEQLFDICDYCVGNERCGRCGFEHYINDETQCPRCGWNFNDGMPGEWECYGDCLPEEAA